MEPRRRKKLRKKGKKKWRRTKRQTRREVKMRLKRCQMTMVKLRSLMGMKKRNSRGDVRG